MNYLGLDYGTKHLGLALATTPLAQPLKSIPIERAFDQLPLLIREYQIDALVVGISEGFMAQLTREFAQKLTTHFELPVHLHDETLSSKEAAKKLRHSSQKKRRGPDHHYAAALVLQDYLDHH